MRRSVTVGSSKKGEGVLLNPTVENATVKGWLSKMGHINTDFKRRYFLLHGSRLAYFESVAAATKGKAKGLITVVKISHLPHGWPDVPPEKVALAFRFDAVYFSAVSGRVDKPFVVYADSLDAKLAWMRALAESTRRADGVPHSAIEDIYRTEITAGMEAGRASQGASRANEPVPASHSASALWKLVGEGMHMAREADPIGAGKRFEETLRRCGHVNQAGLYMQLNCELSRELNPACLVALYELGKLLCESSTYSDALKYFVMASQMSPPACSQQLRLQQAWCTWRQGKLAEAVEMYSSILDDDALCWQALLDRARMYLSTSRWEDGRLDLSLVLGMGRGSAEIHNDRGVCLYELGQYEQALADFNHALSLDEVCCQAYTNRGNCLRKQMLHREAMKDYDRAIQLAPHDAKAFNNRGALALKMSRYEEALSDFEQAVRLEPQYEVARKNLEVARHRRDDAQGGAALLK